MRTGRALALIAVLAVQATCVLGASYASYPNPVGEEVYRPRLLREMLPLAVSEGIRGVLGADDGALLPEHRMGPLQARSEGSEEPFRADGVVVDATEVNVR